MSAWKSLTLNNISSRYFISYRSLNSDLAKLLEGELEGCGQEIWRDRRNLRSSDLWPDEIERAIADCNDMIVLLTPEAANSENVLHEIKTCLRLRKRLHCFATFDFKNHSIYEYLREVHFVKIKSLSTDASIEQKRQFAKAIVNDVLAPQLLPHPLDKRDFERVYSKRLIPAGLPVAMLAQYRGYFEVSNSDLTMLTNFGLILAAVNETEAATSLLRKACSGASAIPHYLLALILLEGRRPKHMKPSVLDEAVRHVEIAWQLCNAPVVALLRGLLLWDAYRKRGTVIQAQFVEALHHVRDCSRDRGEVLRFMRLVPFDKGPILPLPADKVLKILQEVSYLQE